MKTLGYYNGKIDELDQICVPMLDRASYFGDGVYDVTFCRNYKVYQLREHVERIFQSAALIKIYPQITPDELCELFTLPPPALCPPIVILSGSPPKAAILRFAQRTPACWSR